MGFKEGDTTASISDEKRYQLQSLLETGENCEPYRGPIQLSEQQAALKMLHSFLYLGGSSNLLLPFILDISKKSKTRQDRVNPQFNFYLGGADRVNRYLTIHIPEEVIVRSQGSIWAIPRTLHKGEAPYFWLEFYTPTSGELFQECEIDPATAGKTNFRSWHGIEERFLADFILGKNGILFDDLVPVNIDTNSKGSLANYDIAGDRRLRISIAENSKLGDSNSVKLTTMKDDQDLYYWFDITRLPADEEDLDMLITSYRIFRDRRAIASVGWFGPEKQLLIDLLSNIQGINFDSLRPIYFIAREYEAIRLGRFKGRVLDFYSPSGIFSPGEEGVLIPSRDETGLYQWLELFKVDPETRTPVGNIISSGRIHNGGINQKRWLGLERQLFKDYLAGNNEFSSLKPIPLTVGKGDFITLWREREERVYLVVSKAHNLQPGDKVTLSPEEEIDGDAYFTLYKDQQGLENFKFIKAENAFRAKSSGYKQGGGRRFSTISFGEANEQLMRLLEGAI